MIRHIVLLKWTDGTTREQHRTVIDQLGRLPGIIPQIKSYELKSDAGLDERSSDLVVVGDFDTVDDYQIYAVEPTHVQIISDHIKPIVASRAAIQFEI